MTSQYISRAALLGALVLLPLAAACNLDDTNPEPEAEMQLQLTSDPSSTMQSARIWISRIYLQEIDGELETELGREPVWRNSEQPLVLDVLSLVNGNTSTLFEPVGVKAGTFKALRIVVDSAVVTLKPGFTFEDGTTTKRFTIPTESSMSTSGVKVALDGDIVTREGILTTLLLDFEVDESFRLVGPAPTASGGTIREFRLYPVIHEMMRSDVD